MTAQSLHMRCKTRKNSRKLSYGKWDWGQIGNVSMCLADKRFCFIHSLSAVASTVTLSLIYLAHLAHRCQPHIIFLAHGHSGIKYLTSQRAGRIPSSAAVKPWLFSVKHRTEPSPLAGNTLGAAGVATRWRLRGQAQRLLATSMTTV